MTPREYLELLRREWAEHPRALQALETLTECFQRAHYGGEGTPESLQTARQAHRELLRAAPRRRARAAPRRRVGAPAPAAGGGS